MVSGCMCSVCWCALWKLQSITDAQLSVLSFYFCKTWVSVPPEHHGKQENVTSATVRDTLKQAEGCCLLLASACLLKVSAHSICSNICSQICSCTTPAQVSIYFSQLCLEVCIELSLVSALHILVQQHILLYVAVMSTIQRWQYLQTEPQWPIVRHHDILGNELWPKKCPYLLDTPEHFSWGRFCNLQLCFCS